MAPTGGATQQQRAVYARYRRPSRPQERRQAPYLYQRAYSYRCFCGLDVTGSYPAGTESVDGPVDKTRAVCRMTKGAANFPAWSRASAKTVKAHSVGCGRTLAESDAAFEAQRLERKAVAA